VEEPEEPPQGQGASKEENNLCVDRILRNRTTTMTNPYANSNRAISLVTTKFLPEGLKYTIKKNDIPVINIISVILAILLSLFAIADSLGSLDLSNTKCREAVIKKTILIINIRIM